MPSANNLVHQDYPETEAEAVTSNPHERACVRCANYRQGDIHDVIPDLAHTCRRPQLGFTIDLVIGVRKPAQRDCYNERAAVNVAGGALGDESRCGPEGKFFQPSGF